MCYIPAAIEHADALDPKGADLTEQVVAQDKLTTLMVTHSMHQAASLATAKHSIGSMKAGSRVGRERSLALVAIGIVYGLIVSCGGQGVSYINN